MFIYGMMVFGLCPCITTQIFLGPESMLKLLNKRVAIGESLTGVIRYIGSVDGKEGQWIGVELDVGLGQNDGTYGNRRYFTCEPKHGVFIRISRLEIDRDTLSQEVLRCEVREKGTYIRDSGEVVYPRAVPEKHFEKAVAVQTDSVESRSPEKEEEQLMHSSILFTGEAGMMEKCRILERRNKELEADLQRHREVFDEFVDKSFQGVARIRSQLGGVLERIAEIAKSRIARKEKEPVFEMVYGIYVAERRGDREQTDKLYEQFKGVMGKYGINVE